MLCLCSNGHDSLGQHCVNSMMFGFIPYYLSTHLTCSFGVKPLYILILKFNKQIIFTLQSNVCVCCRYCQQNMQNNMTLFHINKPNNKPPSHTTLLLYPSTVYTMFHKIIRVIIKPMVQVFSQYRLVMLNKSLFLAQIIICCINQFLQIMHNINYYKII